ncbi:phosphosulfolactate synthase [soil metagenome]
MGQTQAHPSDHAGGLPAFLDLPGRPAKPRATGRTHVLDTGLPIPVMRAILDANDDVIDLWKFGFGTAYLDATVAHKVTLLADHGVTACIGGTLLEVSWLQDQVGDCLAWAAGIGFGCIEVSNGSTPMSIEDKRALIKRAAADFTVVSEVGSKDADTPVDAAAWRDEMLGDLEAGATLTLAEGRASGTVGLYRPDGSVRERLVKMLTDDVGDRVVFEAPRAAQQAWFVRRLGPAVNLANVDATAVLAVETLRLGLRADTIDLGDTAPPPHDSWQR